MEGFHYVDIFATKGIEYIIVLGFLFLFIMFWRRLNRPSPATVAAGAPDQQSISLVDWFLMADDYHYHQGHTWVKPVQQGTVKVGMDDFAHKFLGKPHLIRLPEPGTRLHQGEEAFVFGIDGSEIPVLSPVDGEVVTVNQNVVDNTDQAQNDPYGKGWMVEIRPHAWQHNLRHLLSGRLARAWMQEQVDRVAQVMTARMGVVLQDGGTINPGFVKYLEPENWEDLAKEFLLVK